MHGGQTAVLVVDDSEDVRGSVARMLDDLGFECREASNGLEALDAVRRRVPDLVLCDLRMPEMDGLQLLATLRASYPNLPVVVMSGAGLLDDAVCALKLGAWDYVEKPIVMVETLEHAVRSALERAALLAENARQRNDLEARNRDLRATLRLLSDDEEAGRQLQFRMLPPNHQTFGRFEFSRELIPSAILSGDFIDAFEIDARHWGFYLADVAGHGVPSALVTVLVRSSVQRVLAELTRTGDERILSAARVLAEVNDEVLRQDLDKHVTLFYGVIDDETNTLTFANAGHFPWPLLYDGTRTAPLELAGPPLGFVANARYDERTIDLPEHAQLVAFSDGLLDVLPHTTLAAKQSFLRVLFGRDDVTLEQVRSELQLDKRAPLPDDIAMLLIKTRGDHARHDSSTLRHS